MVTEILCRRMFYLVDGCVGSCVYLFLLPLVRYLFDMLLVVILVCRKEVCSTSHTRTERPTSGSERGQCETNEVVLCTAHQPPQRRPMDLGCHHLEAIRQQKTTRETSQTMDKYRRDSISGIGQCKTG